MSLQAAEFFDELCLPFPDSAVVGDTYYAIPVLGGPWRLSIGFTRTIHTDTYGGLRAAVLHAERGEIDAVALGFIDHGTFHRRDEALNTPRGSKRYGTFDTHHRPGHPPWEGAVTTGLRDAIERYTHIWFPGAWTAPAPIRAEGRIAGRSVIPTLASFPGRSR
ncbi:hypothetical protein [Streptomyces alkaliphilus]|uniref:hypothetical protein n=1 Tax=Streptomyces alkaliphilus TaxID=1472722 RepID=UPI00117D4EF2|nr:hypothetical protein [Streptomyces alkaliphilus]MQS08055.1 hypothetical protein [Streptomyces alkaliphilus]